VAFNRQLRRGQVLSFFEKLPACLLGMEVCGRRDYWARKLGRLGRQVQLMPPSYLKPYVKGAKSDAADAAAMCEAVRRPTIRFVPIKSASQQGELCQRWVREMLVRQLTQLSNVIGGLMAEFGLTMRKGRASRPAGLRRRLLSRGRIMEPFPRSSGRSLCLSADTSSL
jgi:transposase